MASATEFYNELKAANVKLNDVNGKLEDVKAKLDALKATTDAVRASVDRVDQTLQSGFGTLITLGIYTNQALYQNALQNDTIICILEHISKNTCELVNQAHLQTELQTAVNKNVDILADLYAATHAEATLVREREEALRAQIERCCPPPPRPSDCNYEPCRAPERLPEPPRVETHGPHIA